VSEIVYAPVIGLYEGPLAHHPSNHRFYFGLWPE